MSPTPTGVLNFNTWCVLRADDIERRLDDWIAERQHVWLVHETRWGWYAYWRRGREEVA